MLHALLLTSVLASAPRNLLFDVEALVGTRAHRCRVAPRSDGSGRFLHCIIRHRDGVDDFGAMHPRLWEYTSQLPPQLREVDATRRDSYNGHAPRPVQPAVHRLRRHIFLDLEGIFKNQVAIISAVVLRKRRVTGPPGIIPGHYLHLLVRADPALGLDLIHPGSRLYENLDDVPSALRRADGGPLHVYLGVSPDPPTAPELGP